MSDILARIRVRETAGIRRFLYPLVTMLDLRSDSDMSRVQFIRADGLPVPTEIRSASSQSVKEGHKNYEVRFAISLAPLEEIELKLRSREPVAHLLDDPLNIRRIPEGGLENRQQRFSIFIAKNSSISQVVYDGVTHLRAPDEVLLNGYAAPDGYITPDRDSASVAGPHLFQNYPFYSAYSWKEVGERSIGDCLSVTTLTACKSWAGRYHWLQEPRAQDEVVFTLPLAVTAPTLTCDFGVGGYVFGKLDEKAQEIVWRTTFGDAPYARWTVATEGRTDYSGEVATAAEFLPQRWFHLIDSDKALAVAITQMPPDCRELTVRLTHMGDVSVAFKLGDTVADHPDDHADFGVCYHFLNDVPAIAAATNPQSILLPPVVEVLPE